MKYRLVAGIICCLLLLPLNVKAEKKIELKLDKPMGITKEKKESKLSEPMSLIDILRESLYGKKANKVLKDKTLYTEYIETSVYGVSANGKDLVIDISPKELKKNNIDENDLVLVKLNGSRFILPIEYAEDFDINWGRTYITTTKNKDRIKIVRRNQSFVDMEGYDDRNDGDKVSIILLEDSGYSMDRVKIPKKNIIQAANFRNTVIGDIDEDVIYRGHSPVDPKYNSLMCKAAAKLIKENDIYTMINMNQDLSELEKQVIKAKRTNSYYKSLVTYGDVSSIELNGEHSTSKSFKKGMKKHISFMLNHESPYYIHCRMGKDRTGFLVALLGALEGATYNEIADDYAESFRNYFGTKKGSWMDCYNATDGTNAFLSMMNPGVGSDSFIKNKYLIRESAEKYLLDLGFDEIDIEILKDKLSDNEYDDYYYEDDEEDYYN